MAKKPKKAPSLHQLRIITLRRASMRWKFKYVALNAAKAVVNDGFYKNGNVKTKMMFRCACCKKLYDRREVCVDHRNPVVDPIDGFEDWNTYVPNLLCDIDNLQILCKPCHKIKTKKENSERDVARSKTKK
jgi:hypothetical protein